MHRPNSVDDRETSSNADIVTCVVTESITDIAEERSDEINEAKEVNEDFHRLEEENAALGKELQEARTEIKKLKHKLENYRFDR